MTLAYRTPLGWRAIFKGFIAKRYFPSRRDAQAWIECCAQEGHPL